MTFAADPRQAALADNGAGQYIAEVSIDVQGEVGVRELLVTAIQTTSLGTYVSRIVKRVTVAASEDLVIYGDAVAEGWSVRRLSDIATDPAADTEVYEGSSSLSVVASTVISLGFEPMESVDASGYSALRLAIHPGDVQLSADASLTIVINGNGVDLLVGDGEHGTVDLQRREWQVVEVPVAVI